MNTSNNSNMLNSLLEAIVAIILTMLPIERLITAIQGRSDEDQSAVKDHFGGSDKAESGDTQPITPVAVEDRVTSLLDSYPEEERKDKLLIVARKLVALVGGGAVSDLLTDAEIKEAAVAEGLVLADGDAIDACRTAMDAGNSGVGEFMDVLLEYDCSEATQAVYNYVETELLEFFDVDEITDHFLIDALLDSMDADDVKQWLKDNDHAAIDLSTVREAAEAVIEALDAMED
jgi:hypothetical protein